jgi:uncharacterized membrane protein YccF (DUF307 family)
MIGQTAVPAHNTVLPTMANTRGIAFAIWWKVCLVWIAAGGVLGFVATVLPYGQMRFWLSAFLVRPFGNRPAAMWLQDHAELAIDAVAAVLSAALIFLFINWIVASHAGRRFEGYRLMLQRVE